jgi:hypothetical protein
MANQTSCCDGGEGLVFPILLVVVGSVLLAEKFGMIEFQEIWRYWPLALIGLGVHMLLNPGERCS